MKNLKIVLLFILASLAFTSFKTEITKARNQQSNPKKEKKSDTKNLKLAFVTNNASDFWTIAQKGVEKADAELDNVTVEFKMPTSGGVDEQERIIGDLVSTGIDGIAVSPVDPENQTQYINEIAGKTLVITQDADAPKSDRAVYVGTDNVAAGRQAGELIKKALPNGGKIMLFVGLTDALNAKERIQGIREVLNGTKIKILGVRTDYADFSRAKGNAAKTLAKYPKISALVGIWSYNGPAIYNAVKEAGKKRKVKIICFDDEADTLNGIKEGAIYGTVVMQPFEFGYQAIIAMNKILTGDKSIIPVNKRIIVPTLVIKKDNVEEFRKKLVGLRGN
ncbi:MAG: sugar-binding protein [Pyrinomonadaceae bacterium]|nr:sugar-binding protein [Pyrinomonadaceae bacterium]